MIEAGEAPGWFSTLGWVESAEGTPAIGEVGRVAVEHRGYYDVFGAGQTPFELTEGVAVTPRLRKSAASPIDFPAVGDWVELERADGPDSPLVITGVLERTSLFVRRAPGREPRPQVVGTNIGRVFIVSGLDGDLNPRRLERYLAVVWGGGAEAVVVLSKADLVDPADIERSRHLVRSISADVPVVVSSIETGRGVGELAELIPSPVTAALVGSSGVGKSSIINELIGEYTQDVAATQRDGRGRHTTIRRHLISLPDGGLMIDTPGMREIQLWNADGLAWVFADIVQAARACRFSDCSHGNEPDCGVLEAVASGEIDADSVSSFGQLSEELGELSDELARRQRVRRR